MAGSTSKKLCLICRYDLSGLPEECRCPECGTQPLPGAGGNLLIDARGLTCAGCTSAFRFSRQASS